jgi:small-conductance mechanosensitive channel
LIALLGKGVLMDLVNSLKRFALVLVVLIVATLGVVFLFDQLIAAPIGLSILFAQTTKTLIVVVCGGMIMLFIRRSRPLVTGRVGVHVAPILQFLTMLTVGMMMIFTILDIFQVSPTALLVGGGIVSIIMGLVISTFVGNILAGTLVLVTNPFRTGDTVLVNNVPGKIVEITAMVTRIRNDIGGELVIPNTAIVQGAVIVTKIPAHETVVQSRLPYTLGDRVYTTYLSGEGVVRELSPFYTRILLDSGKELTFLNTSVLTGTVAVAKISSESDDNLKFSFKTDRDPRGIMNAIKDMARSNAAIFKSSPTMLYLSLDRETVELAIDCKVDPSRKREARSLILESAYLSGSKKR